MTEMTTPEKLAECPFCGAHTAYTAPPALGKGRWVVQCDDCRAEGPTSSDNSDAGEDEAIASWNQRTRPAPAPDVVGELGALVAASGPIVIDALGDDLAWKPLDDTATDYWTILTALRAPDQGWQPIETAPKDGTWVLGVVSGIHHNGEHYIPAVVHWDNGLWTENETAGSDDEDWHLTHWMPLPLPPKDAGQ